MKHYYIAFVIDEDVMAIDAKTGKPCVRYEAGADLLAGPFLSRHEAHEELPITLRRVRRYYTGAWLAAKQHGDICHLCVMSTDAERVAQVNQTLPESQRVAYPPPILERMTLSSMRHTAKIHLVQIKHEIQEARERRLRKVVTA